MITNGCELPVMEFVPRILMLIPDVAPPGAAEIRTPGALPYSAPAKFGLPVLVSSSALTVLIAYPSSLGSLDTQCRNDHFIQLASIFFECNVNGRRIANDGGLACIPDDREYQCFPLRCLDRITPIGVGLGSPRTALYGDSCPGYGSICIRHHPCDGL